MSRPSPGAPASPPAARRLLRFVPTAAALGVLAAAAAWRSPALAVAGAAGLLAAYETYPRLWRRLATPGPWRGPAGAWPEAARAEAVRQMAEPARHAPERAGLHPTRLEDLLRGVRERVDPDGWPPAMLAYCLLRAEAHRPSATARAAVDRLVDARFDAEGRPRRPPTMVPWAMIGYPLLELDAATGGSPRLRAAARRTAEFLLAHRRTGDGLISYYGPETPDLLVDTLPMICPFLARFGREEGRPEATALAVAHLEHFLDHAVDGPTGLPFHGYFGGPAGAKLGALGWARGTGFLAIGLADTLAELPADHPARGRLGEALARLAAAVRPHQTPEGYWRWVIPLYYARPDTSGTTMIGYAIARAVRLGLLDGSFLPLAEGALRAAIRSTDETGRVGDALPDSFGPAIYPQDFGPAPWAQGPAVALHAELARAGPAAAPGLSAGG